MHFRETKNLRIATARSDFAPLLPEEKNVEPASSLFGCYFLNSTTPSHTEDQLCTDCAANREQRPDRRLTIRVFPAGKLFPLCNAFHLRSLQIALVVRNVNPAQQIKRLGDGI